ncbi:TolC family protein [Campylobacter sp. 7477a]|uniref:TolC family protein n=1 Tax=Campylobacter sp. 7477a TaxID=2735741 RepID=UPI003014CBAD|nr:TolC family protein [Campylobacter sp. 7477a]
MKKIFIVGMIVAATISSAKDLTYRVFLGAFTQSENETKLTNVKQNIKDIISQDERLSFGSYAENGREFLYVDTSAISASEADNILTNLRATPGYSDAYMKIKSENFTNLSKTDIADTKKAKESFLVQTSQSNFASTQTNGTDKNSAVTLNEVIKTVLSENPSLKETEYNYLQVGKDLNIAKNAYYPTLDAQASVGHERRRLDNDTNTRTGNGRISSATLTLVENLYNGGADKNRINSQSARLDSAAYSVAQRADRLALEMVNAYVEVIKTKKILDIEDLNVKNHEEIYSQIKDRAQSGYGIASEERQAGSRYTLAQSNYISAANNYEDAVSTFERLYGKKLFAQNLIEPEFNIPLPTNEQAVYDRALLCNPSLLVQRSNVAMAESVVKEKNAPFLPKVDLVVSGGYDHTDVLYNNYEDQSVNALVRFNYNLYNKGNDKLDKEKSQLAVRQEQQALETLTRELRESLKFSWQSYELEQKKMSYLAQHVEYAKATLDAYQDEFKIGRRDLINLLDAESEYNTALKEIINTETALIYAKYRLLDNMGLLADSFEPGFAKRYIQGACSIQNDLK